MAVTIIVEDGSCVPNANSYIDVEYATQYLEDRGVKVPAEDKLKPMLINAMDFMESLNRYKGKRTNQDQELQFPRSGLYSDGVGIPGNTIPVAIKRAQAQLVADTVQSGKPLLSNSTNHALKKRVLGPLTLEYAVGQSAVLESATPHPRFWALINDYLRSSGSQGVMR